MVLLSRDRASRLQNLQTSTRRTPDLQSDFCMGLDATTRAIQQVSDQEIAEPTVLAKTFKLYTGGVLPLDTLVILQRNTLLASLVREAANEAGWLAGWICLAQACPDSGIHPQLLDDVCLGVDVYNNIRASDKPRKYETDLHFSVVSQPQWNSLTECGLKTIGGDGWKADSVYKQAVRDWMCPEDLVMGPCPIYGWMGQCKKVENLPDASTANYYWTSQLLGIVDYDMDKDTKVIPGGIGNAIRRTAQVAAGSGDARMRGLGWCGLLTVDQQLFTREMQVKWVREGKGSRLIGPSNIPPADFSIACYSDCAALGPFACNSARELIQSRKTMFGAVLLGNLHDLVFDIGYSSRISGAAYADATGAFEFDGPQAWLVGLLDGIAEKILRGPEDQNASYGDNSLCVTAMWSIFNVRYRAWERFVKYTRLLQRSKSPKAAAILRRAQEGMVFVPGKDIEQDLGDAWAMAVDPQSAAKLKPRCAHTRVYLLRNGQNHETKTTKTSSLAPPSDLCQTCRLKFTLAFNTPQDRIQAIPGLPESVTNSEPIQLATTIRRAALWAATSSECCDSCACQIGLWANEVSDRVLVALMKIEKEISNREWLLQNYFAGCVAFSPLRLITITTGFDLVAKISYETEAMGERDNNH
ncbi:hypothetical protein BJX66DRAFT_337594 [Aspergillus keveii]|uniref:Uncharacterized protein n=1 Tax=Aspergillus keveii TaxID=714993 RepID=A0ABR4G7Y6_9EURO